MNSVTSLKIFKILNSAAHVVPGVPDKGWWTSTYHMQEFQLVICLN